MSDEEWALLEPLLPDRGRRRGGRWVDHRVVVDGIRWGSAHGQSLAWSAGGQLGG